MTRAPAKRLLPTLAVVAGVLAAIAPPALAGSYTISTCSPLTSPGPWVAVNATPAALTVGQACGGPALGPIDGGDQDAMYAEDNLGSSAQIPNGGAAGWTFTAPPQSTITAISYYRSLASNKSSDLVSGLFLADGTALEQCMIVWPFPPGSSIVCSKPNTQAPVTFTGLNTAGLFFGLACRIVDGASACIDGGTIHNAQADMYSARITLSQAAVPTIAQPAGVLWGGGVVAGVAPVTFSASDPSGIAQAVVRSESGQAVASLAQSCNFTVLPPCPQLPAASLAVDTTSVGDGPHTFAVAVTDAAGNTQSTSSPMVVVDNHGPPPPVHFTATAQGGNSNAIGLAWTNPASPQPVTGAMVELCQASCATPLRINPTGTGQVTAPGSGQFTLRLWLLDAQGRGGPQNAATATVTVPTSAGGTSGPTGSTAASHTRLSATYKASRLHVTATMASAIKDGTPVTLSWRAHSRGHTLAKGSRVVRVRLHKLSTTFSLPVRARRGTIGVAATIAGRHIAGALAHPA